MFNIFSVYEFYYWKSHNAISVVIVLQKLIKAPTREFIVFNCCSCTRLKLAINELFSLRCSSMPENAAFNISFSSSPGAFLLLLLLSSCSFSFGFFSIFCCLRLQRSPLHCLLPQRHQYTRLLGACLSNVTECHAISATEYFVDLLIKDGLFSISPALVPVPILRCLVTVYPVLHFLLAFVASFLGTAFGAQLTCDPFPHSSSILALKVIKIFCPKTD